MQLDPYCFDIAGKAAYLVVNVSLCLLQGMPGGTGPLGPSGPPGLPVSAVSPDYYKPLDVKTLGYH